MKIRWTVVLLVINLLLIWGVVDQFCAPPVERSFNSQMRSFLPLSRADWDGLGVSTSGFMWSASRDRWGHWWIKAPFDWPAKEGVVSRMNGYLLTLQVDSAFAVEDLGRVGQSLHSYGLDNPRAILQVSSGAKGLSYKIGNTTPLGNKVYVLSSDQKEIWVVDSGINEFISYKPSALRQEGFFPFNLMELESVEVTLRDDVFTYSRVPGSALWQLKMNGRVFPVGDGMWEKWMKLLSSAQVAEISGPDLLQQSSKGSVGMIVFQTLYGRRTLYLGGSDKTTDTYQVQWEGEKQSFGVPASNMGVMDPNNFVNPHPVSLNPEDISSLDWTDLNGTISLRRLESGQWVVASLANAAASTPDIKDLLMRLSATQGVPLIKKSPTQSDLAYEKVRLGSASGDVELWISRQKGKVLVMTNNGFLVYDVDGCPQRPALKDLLENAIFPAGIAQLSGFSFSSLKERALTKDYSLESPQGKALRSLIGSTPKVSKWLEASEGKQLGDPSAKMDLHLHDKTLSVDLWHSQRGWIGRIDGRYFEMGSDMAAFLDVISAL